MDKPKGTVVSLPDTLTPEQRRVFEYNLRIKQFNNSLVESAFDLSSIEETPPVWICKNILAEGCMSLLFGDAGAGKTKFAVSLAAWLTGIGKGVFYMTTEASFGMQIKGQFLAQNGQTDYFKGSTKPCTFTDLTGFKDFMDDLEADVLIIDTLINYSGQTNTWSDYEIGQMLQPLRRTVFETKKAVLVCHHRNKGGNSNELYQISGSGQLAAQFSQVIGLAKVEDGSSERRAKIIKSNIGKDGLVLDCQIDPMEDKARALMSWADGAPTFWKAPPPI